MTNAVSFLSDFAHPYTHEVLSTTFGHSNADVYLPTLCNSDRSTKARGFSTRAKVVLYPMCEQIMVHTNVFAGFEYITCVYINAGNNELFI